MVAQESAVSLVSLRFIGLGTRLLCLTAGGRISILHTAYFSKPGSIKYPHAGEKKGWFTIDPNHIGSVMNREDGHRLGCWLFSSHHVMTVYTHL